MRAVVVGVVLGALLAAANTYACLSIGYMDGGNIVASALSFALFAVLRPRHGYTERENNITQAIASSAALMSFTAGLVGAIPGLLMLGHTYPWWGLMCWGIALALLGVGVALLLRTRLLITDNLPFPTGKAAGELIVAMHQGASAALRRARLLMLAGAVAALITLARDVLHAFPLDWFFPGAIAGVSLAALSMGVSLSPLVLSTGLMIGARGGFDMLLGSLLGWLLLVPQLVRFGTIDATHLERATNWLMWPGTAMVVASSFTSLGLDWRSTLGALQDLTKLRARDANRTGGEQLGISLVLIGLGTSAVLALAYVLFEMTPGKTLLVVLGTMVLAAVCARAAGETDTAPAGTVGGISQMLFGRPSVVTSLASGALTAGVSCQVAGALWAMKSGLRVGASLRAQVWAQIIGAVVGALVVVPVYALLIQVYGLGSPQIPSAGVLSWTVTAEAVTGGAGMPPFAGKAALIAFALGILFTWLGRAGNRFAPSPVALGIGFFLPPAMCVTVCLGGFAAGLLAKKRPAFSEEFLPSMAGGAIAGEALLAVLLAALSVLGLR
ncbi:MAG: OPT/YSL family transporter [Myxococcales bacterium]